MAEAFPISGQIDPKTFPFLLMNLHRQGATGSFKVEGPTYQKALYFRAGRILFGSSNDPRDQLGAILIEDGKITPEQLEDVNSKVGPGSPLAKVLAETGFVNQRELSEAARTKVERILSDIIAYASGSFEFEDGVLPKGAVDLKLSTEKLVLAAVRRIQDRNFVLRHLSGLGVVLLPTFESDGKMGEVQADGGGLVEQLDGVATLKEAAERARLDEFEAAKVACALLFLGVVERREARAAAGDLAVFILEDDEASELDLSETARAAFLVEDEEPRVTAAGEIEPSPQTERSSQVPAPIPPEPVVDLPRAVTQPRESSAMEEPRSPAFIGLPPIGPPDMPAPFVAEPPPPRREPLHSVPSALDIILDAKTHEGPLEPLERPISPRLSPGDRHASRAVGAAGLSRVVWFGGAAGVLVLVAGVTWFFFLRRTQPQAVAGVSPPPHEAPASSQPTTTVASPSLAVSPTASTATVAAPTPSPAAAEPPTARARRLLRAGQFSEAAGTFLINVKEAPKGTFTVQLFVACSAETVQKAVDAVDSMELFILPMNYQGRSCYRLCWGLYPQEARAASAIGSLPEYFRKGGASPRVLPSTQVVP